MAMSSRRWRSTTPSWSFWRTSSQLSPRVRGRVRGRGRVRVGVRVRGRVRVGVGVRGRVRVRNRVGVGVRNRVGVGVRVRARVRSRVRELLAVFVAAEESDEAARDLEYLGEVRAEGLQ